jgi:hypothetical protein
MAELLYINSSGADIYGQSMLSQSITPDDDWTVTSVWVDAIYVTSGSTATIEIYEDNGGDPNDGTLIATSDVTTVGAGSPAAATFNFSVIVELDNAQKYHLVYVPGAGGVYWYRTTTNVYSGGGIQYSADSGSSWTSHESSFDQRQLKVNGSVGHVGGESITPLSSSQMFFDPNLGIFRKAGETDTVISKGDMNIGNDQGDIVTITSSGTLLSAAGALVLRDSLTVSGTGNITGAFIAASISGTHYGDGSNLTGVGGGASAHGALTGLSDDDHTHYALIDGSRAFTNDVTISGSTTVGGISSNITFSTTSGIIGVSGDTNLIHLATGEVTIGGSASSMVFNTTSGTIGVSNDTDLIQLDGTTGVTVNGDLHVSTGWTGSIPTISGTITVVDGIITNYS